LVLDLRLTHDRIGSSANPALNGTLHYPNNIDESLNQSANPNAVAFIPAIAGTNGRLHSYIPLIFGSRFIDS
jgi:hypothetical protein